MYSALYKNLSCDVQPVQERLSYQTTLEILQFEIQNLLFKRYL